MKVFGRSTSLTKAANDVVGEDSEVPLKVKTGIACVTKPLAKIGNKISHIFRIASVKIFCGLKLEGREQSRVKTYSQTISLMTDVPLLVMLVRYGHTRVSSSS